MITKNCKLSPNQATVIRHWFVFCVIGCFLLGTSVAFKLSNDDAAETSDLFALNCPALKVITRKEWLAAPPQKPLQKLTNPVPKAIIAHTATELCETQADCTFQVRTIQTFHMESRGWDDIGYNFLVGGDGAVYVGRGWDHVGAHTKGHNANSMGIAFIGTFNQIKPSQQQLCAAQQLLKEGHKLGKLSNDYALYGQRQLFATQSPGTALYNIIKTWEHWQKTF